MQGHHAEAAVTGFLQRNIGRDQAKSWVPNMADERHCIAGHIAYEAQHSTMQREPRLCRQQAGALRTMKHYPDQTEARTRACCWAARLSACGCGGRGRRGW